MDSLKSLNLMLLVANLANTNDAKNLKNDWTPGTWVFIYKSVFNESYLINTSMTELRWFLKNFALLCCGRK